jgi:hypothetical protein
MREISRRQFIAGVATTALASRALDNSATKRERRTMTINVMDSPYNAVGDGLADDYPALAAALADAAASGRGRKVIAPYGVYRHTQPLNMDGVGITLEGEGSGDKVAPFGAGLLGPTTFVADYEAGAGLRIWERNCIVRGIRFDSSPLRMAAPFSVLNAGIRIEPEDVTNARVDWTYLDDVYTVGHPGDGIMFSGGEMVRSGIHRSGATNCKGHGIAIVGNRTGRADKARPGQMAIEDCYVQRCHGNGLVIGSPDIDEAGLELLPYRMRVTNVELIRLGTIGGPRFGGQAAWAFGEDIEFKQCGFGGTDINGVNGHLAGIYAAGRDIRLLSNRYIQTSRGVSVGNRSSVSTKDFVIDGASVSQDAPAPLQLNPFCVVTSGASGVKIRAHATSEVLNWASGPAGSYTLDIIP